MTGLQVGETQEVRSPQRGCLKYSGGHACYHVLGGEVCIVASARVLQVLQVFRLMWLTLQGRSSVLLSSYTSLQYMLDNNTLAYLEVDPCCSLMQLVQFTFQPAILNIPRPFLAS